MARPERAPRYVRLAATLGRLRSDDPLVQVLNVTHIPEQTPHETVEETARGRADRIEDHLTGADLDVEYTVEGHICRDVAFDIVQTAREDGADLIVMGYPEDHPRIAEGVEYQAPCGVLFASGVTDVTALDVVTIGAGGGPHHLDLLDLLGTGSRQGAEIHVVNVAPAGGGGRPETVGPTVEELSDVPSVSVHTRAAGSVAQGLVEAAADHGGILVIGATRTRRLRRWVFGSTPDRVIELARDADVPVLVYASPRGVQGPIEDYLYPVYRYLTGRDRREPVDATALDPEG